MGTCRRPSWTAMVWPTISGKMVDARDQVRSTSLRPLEFIDTTRRISFSSTYGPFFRLLLIPQLASYFAPNLLPGPHDELVGALAAARLLAHGHLAPLRLW